MGNAELRPGVVHWVKKFTYVIRARVDNALTDTMTVKIGQADDPAKRLAALQTASPYVLDLLCFFPNEGNQAERALHAKYARYRLSGEWFRLPSVFFWELVEATEEDVTGAPHTFRYWLMCQSGRRDPVGDLARDAHFDYTWAGDDFKALRDSMRHCGACRDAIEAWKQAVREFSSSRSS